MSKDPFVKPLKSYKRDLNPITNYIHIGATHLTITKGMSYEDATTFVKNVLKTNPLGRIVNPMVKHVASDVNGDRYFDEIPLTKYINCAVSEGDILSPDGTIYKGTHKAPSIQAMYITSMVNKRKISKKNEKIYKFAPDKKRPFLQGYYNRKQKAEKLRANGTSGAYQSPSTILYRPTSHNTLTSNCRVFSNTGVVLLEKLLTGNRFYPTPNSAITNITTIVANYNKVELATIMSKYKLTIPSVEHTMACVRRSSDLYWTHKVSHDKILELIRKLNDLDRAAFVYIGDLHQLMSLNRTIVRDMFLAMSEKKEYTGVINEKEILGCLQTIDTPFMELAHRVCYTEVMGMGKDYSAMYTKGVASTVLGTAQNAVTTVENYFDFLQCFFSADILTSGIAHAPVMRRRCVLRGDTDSNLVTVADVVRYLTFDNINEVNVDYMPALFDDTSNRISAAVTFLLSQSIRHPYIVISKNMGFSDDNLTTMEMKNEYYWPVFADTLMTKHYWALCLASEGNIYAVLEKELKGAHLIASTLPEEIVKQAHKLMFDILKSLYDGKKISVIEIIKLATKIEIDIKTSVEASNLNFFKDAKVNTVDSYKNDDNQNGYRKYEFWMEVFKPKYGDTTPPPYIATQIPLTINNKTAMSQWLNDIKDDGMRLRLSEWLTRMGKKDFPNVYLPKIVLETVGIPEELIPIIDVKQIQVKSTGVFRVMLEVLGYSIPDNATFGEYFDIDGVMQESPFVTN